MSSPNNPIDYLRESTKTLIVEALAVPQAGFTAVQTLPAGTVFALGVFSAAPGNLTVQHDGDADRVEFRAAAVDYQFPSRAGSIPYPPNAAHTLEFRSANACNLTLWAWVAPTTV